MHTCVICKKVNSGDRIEFIKDIDFQKKHPVCFDCRDSAMERDRIESVAEKSSSALRELSVMKDIS